MSKTDIEEAAREMPRSSSLSGLKTFGVRCSVLTEQRTYVTLDPWTLRSS